MYDLHKTCEAHPDYWLKDSSGHYVYIQLSPNLPKVHIFDLANQDMREAWLDVLRNAKAGGADGAFLDRGNSLASMWDLSEEHAKAWDAGHVHIVEEAGKIFNDGVVIGNDAYIGGVNGRMFEVFGHNRRLGWGKLPADIAAIESPEGRGKIIEVHGEPLDLKGTEACSPEVFNITLTGFLIGVQENMFYFCSDSWDAQQGWDKWHPEFDRPLGEPTAPANVRNLTDGRLHYERTFKSGTKAILEATGEKGDNPLACVCWSGGEITGPSACSAHCSPLSAHNTLIYP